MSDLSRYETSTFTSWSGGCSEVATGLEYQGDELELFAMATNWKRYFQEKLAPFLGRRVLEVGAGLGAVTRTLLPDRFEEWTCLEPDQELASQIPQNIAAHPARDRVKVVGGVTADLSAATNYDTVVYIDVLEHVEDDSAELHRAASLLESGGRCIVLSPAYPSLYTPFDAAIGHHRRYTARSLAAAAPATLEMERVFYLDSVGLLASVGNKLLLRQSLPTRSQILFWDRTLIPLSRMIDPLIGFRVGRSVIAVWRKR